MEPITTKSIGIDGTVFKERRSETRHRVLKGGRLTFNKGFGALECIVRNLSAHGARLAFGDATAVPARFDLIISGDDRVREARVRWRTQTVVGIELDTAADDTMKSAA